MNATLRIKRSRRHCTNGRKRRLSADKRQRRRVARRFENTSLRKDGVDYTDRLGGKNGRFSEYDVI
jgi:hypothetical protein